ncbi:MAG: hypothetical protein J7K94_05665 [Dehalococcoidia bacterium]|nr:hypothetical protein [Dehalococcoidia bacterium]
MSFPESIVQKVWEKGIINLTSNPDIWRQDMCGAWIVRDDYGDRNSPYGWKITRIEQKPKAGGDEVAHLQPLHWGNEASGQDGILTCKVGAWGITNVHRRQGTQTDIVLPQ